MKELIGTGVALVTPFDEKLKVDFKALEKLVNKNIEEGTNYLVVLGTTAESANLTPDEKKKVIDCITKTNNGRLPMVLGIGGNDTMKVSEEIKHADLSNFCAVLSVTPYYNRPNQDGLYQHYEYIASHTDAKIILYNVPSRTGCNMESKTTLKLARDFKNIIAIKEASPQFTQSTEIIKDKPEGFQVISGDDEYSLPMTLAGGSGVISVIGQALCQPFSTMIQKGLKREVDAGYQLHYELMKITRAIYKEGNPAGIKALLSLQGVCQPYTRLPLVPASKNLTEELQKDLREVMASN